MVKLINKNRRSIGPITVMIIIGFFTMILSFLLNKIGVKSTITEPGTFETTVVTVKNIFSRQGLQYIFSDAVKNFRALEPLAIIVISLVGVSVLQVSGLLKHIFGGFKSVRPSFITFLVLFISIVATVIGDYSYALFFPLFAILYQVAGRDPKLAIMTVFIGITAGYGAGLIYNYQDIVLGGLTQISAVEVINDYVFNEWSMIFISIVATFVLATVGTVLIEKNLVKRTKKEEEPELITSPQALRVTGLVFAVLIAGITYSLIPGLPLSGWLLDNDAPNYIEKMFGINAPFREGFLVIFAMVTLVCGAVYGHISRNIKSGKEFSKAISVFFQGTGFIFAGLFFFSIMFGMLEWTGISTVLSLKLINLMANSQMTGIFLIISMFVICIVVTMLNPNSVQNWTLASPIFVPLMMRANISPEFTQMIFKAADAVGKCFTPFYVFLIVMIGFLYKYDTQNEDISLFGTMRKIMPVVVWLALTWLIIIVGWNLLGFALGFGTTTTL